MADKKDLISKVIESTCKNITSKYGHGTAMILGKSSKMTEARCIPTGILALDRAVYGEEGGIPRGMLVEITGWESTAKTLLAKKFAASVQKGNGVAIFIDSEASLDVSLAKKMGMDVDNLVYVQPESIEQVFDIMESAIDDIRKSGVKEDMIIIWDSIASTPIKSELEGKANMGERARIISEGLRTLTSKISKQNVTLVFVNQLREKIGVVYGDPTTTPGGNAVRFHAALRIRMSKKGQVFDNDKVIGEYFEADIKKNKVAPPFKKVLFKFIYEAGISEYSGMVEYLMSKDIIRDRAPGKEKGTGWYWFVSDEKGVDEKSKELIVSKKYRYDDIEKEIVNRPDLLKI